jgi:hypothetical protein
MSELKDIYRPLTEWERRIILKLLQDSPFTGRDALLVQLEHVVGQIIDENGGLSLKCSSALKAVVKTRVPVMGDVPDIDGMVIHYLLHVVDGKMNELEIYKDDSSKILRQAEPEELKVMNFG